MNSSIIALILTGAITVATAYGQNNPAREAAKTKADSIPDKVETAIGELEFFDGVPNDATIDKLYDNLDRMRMSSCRR